MRNLSETASPGAQQGGDQEFNYTFHSLSLEGINIANPHLTIIPEQMGTKDYDNTVVTGSMITKANDGMQPEFIIGMDVLSKLHLYIAYGEKKLYITPPDQPVAAAGH